MATARGNDFFTNLNTTVANSKIFGLDYIKMGNKIKLQLHALSISLQKIFSLPT